MSRPFGVYVHFPYCTHRCPYCDFAVSTEAPPAGGRYGRALLAELEMRAPEFADLAPASLYLGGGTPSLWDPPEVAQVIAAVRVRLGLPSGAEVTLETNPESCDEERLRAWREAGVNRLSIGVQSFDPGVLRKLGRRHAPEAAEAAIRAAARAIGSVSVDLIYGARRSTVETARSDAERAAAAGAVHLSAYALTLDPEVLAEEVPFARMVREGRLSLPGPEETIAQAAAIRAALRRAGLRRYEISNFARPGRESVHNRLYWEGESYLGLGAGAWGCRRGEERSHRYGNLRAPGAWLAAVESGRLPTAEEEEIAVRAERNERLMLALRTSRGHRRDALGPGQRRIEADLLRHRLAVARGGRLVLTSRGMDLHTAVAARLIE
jgi:oxygen-independent coproporphyrinogen-3 oxidase